MTALKYNYNLVVTGVGGQGVITLAKIIAESARLSNYEVRMSEVHGLAQRGGHIECHVRFGKKIFSSLVENQQAHIIIALEPLEALRTLRYVNPQTHIIINEEIITPISIYTKNQPYPSLQKINQIIKKFTAHIKFIKASSIVKNYVGNTVTLNTFILGYLFYHKLLPLERKNILKALQNIIKPAYLSLNKQVFDLNQKLNY